MAYGVVNVQGKSGDYVPLSGSAGEVSYYETTTDITTVDEDSAGAIETADAVSISDGTSGTAWTKVIHLTGDSPTVTTGDNWYWSDGESPELETGCFVVACWLGSAGLLTYHNIG